ncbi:MAG: helix-turn-helix transcriptional regulator [Planctomycetaceae bacterium]|jgi:ArsR family transcriptional regulator, lead/cadmium/zinc/bismuth-responsive transcriptional repressor|nr:helix-turn-helix transcriptional regulator [Planctomycetaceae bacterium]MBT6153787.1 helix-turn-helix transcriptional regulator [Planctomycetaceae bacterium]MBT6485047.1 helix-turn-helix transcriptional regulator [Planctomycetaceae bacterium]MBT6495536.1 helix-turn-helix transcriptional regulator [Planctomycetaceae bacterium]
MVEISNSQLSQLEVTFQQQPAARDRPLIAGDQAAALMQLFKVFANDTRLRLLHALVREDELCVGDLAEAVGMKPQAVSNQLQRLVDRGIIGSRRDGVNIYYRIIDPCVPVLLERGLCLIECCPEEK